MLKKREKNNTNVSVSKLPDNLLQHLAVKKYIKTHFPGNGMKVQTASGDFRLGLSFSTCASANISQQCNNDVQTETQMALTLAFKWVKINYYCIRNRFRTSISCTHV